MEGARDMYEIRRRSYLRFIITHTNILIFKLHPSTDPQK